MKIAIFHATAGEGHRRAAVALEAALLRAGVDKKDILVEDSLDYGLPFFKQFYTGFYYWCVKLFPRLWGALYYLSDHPVMYALVYPFRRLQNYVQSIRLVKKIRAEKPDIIVCTHFLTAEVFGHEKKCGRLAAELVVVVTDFFPVRVWIHPGVDFYWVLSEEAKKILIDRGVPAGNIAFGGFPIMPEFNRALSREEVYQKHGLERGRMTLLVTTGSFGLGEQERLLDLLSAYKEKIQCLVVCGRNQKMFDLLSKKKYDYPVRVFGFVNFMAELMDAADLIVAKPGGATTAEAMAKRVPMIANGGIPGQETENLKFLLKANAIFSADTTGDIVKIVGQAVANPQILEEKRRASDLIAKPHAAEDFAQMRFQWSKT